MEPGDEALGAAWLAERYQIAGLRAHGALSAVYQGQDAVLQRPVAIKAPHPPYAEMYRSTLDVTATLAHPAFLSVYDTVQQDGRLYLAYEFIEGRPLSDYIAAGLPVRRAVAIMAQVTRALAYAHSHGVIHGDLTPASILVDRAAQARVANAGVDPDGAYFDDVAASAFASGVADDPDTTATLLTDDSGRFDCWAAVAILWQLVTDKVVSSDPEALARDWRTDTPASLRQVIEQTLRLTNPDAIESAARLDERLTEIEESLATAADHTAETLPPTISALRAAREQRAQDASADQARLEIPPLQTGPVEALSSRWRRSSGVSPTAVTDYNSLVAEDEGETDRHRTHPADEGHTNPPEDDEIYVARAPRLNLPARSVTPDAAISPASGDRPPMPNPHGVPAPAHLGAWVWALVSLAVFALCYLLGFFLAPLAPFLKLP